MLWLSPALLSIFLVPFFLKGPRALSILGAIFIYWFTTWSLGLHFSRVFMAGASVPILIAALIASLQVANLSKFQRYLRVCVQVGLVLIVLVFVPAQIREAGDNYPGLSALAGPTSRYQSNADVLNNTFLPFYEVHTELPSMKEAKAISGILGRYPNAVVHSDITTGMNILFKNGFFIGIDGPEKDSTPAEFHNMADCILLNRDSSLTGKQRDLARVAFTNVEFVTSTHAWELRCK